MEHRRHVMLAIVAACILAGCGQEQAQQGSSSTTAAAPPSSLRLYVFDCGSMQADLTRFRLEPSEVATNVLATPCFMVAHPKGTMMWDVGAVPDQDWMPTGSPVAHHLSLPDQSTRDLMLNKPLLPQLALEERLMNEVESNPVLEVMDQEGPDSNEIPDGLAEPDRGFDAPLETVESHISDRLSGDDQEWLFKPRTGSGLPDEDRPDKMAALEAAPDRAPSLAEHLIEQLRFTEMGDEVRGLVQDICWQLSPRGMGLKSDRGLKRT